MKTSLDPARDTISVSIIPVGQCRGLFIMIPRQPYESVSGIQSLDVGSAARGSHSVAQLPITLKTGARAAPLPVKEYSIRTGVSGKTSRWISPSASSSFNRSERTLPLKFVIELSIPTKRCGPERSWNNINAVHRLLNISMAFSNRGHICDWFTIITSFMFIISLLPLGNKLIKTYQVTW
jgi:hypothetical protein